MTNQLPSTIGALIGDVIGLFGQPFGGSVGNAAGAAFGKLLRRRLEKARDVLLSELRDGTASLSDVGEVDEIAAVIFRFARAAAEGSARLNLRLMAKIIAGQAEARAIYPDQFLRYADMIASLSREEIILIATIYKHQKTISGSVHDDEIDWKNVREATIRDLVPTPFSTDAELNAIAFAVSRTGLIIPNPLMVGGSYHLASPLMERLNALASFDEALEQEPE